MQLRYEVIKRSHAMHEAFGNSLDAGERGKGFHKNSAVSTTTQ